MAMGVKTGTKTWNDNPRDFIQKTDPVQTISANEKEKMGEDLGATLNKIADPNYIDPSKRLRAVGSDKLDKDAFMKLMLAQMKNQDPTNPLKSHEMAAQLAQFTGVEQMMNMNTTLTELKNGQKPSESFQALNFIGKSVAGDSAKVTRLKGDTNHDFLFQLPQNAQEVTIKVRNQEGEIIRSTSLKELKKGENRWTWNGQTEMGTQSPVGEYQFFVEAKGSNGSKLAVKTDFEGQISGVSYTSDGPVLLIGNQSVKLSDVKKIVDPTFVKSNKDTSAQVGQDLKNPSAQGNNESKGAEEGAQEVPKQGSNIMDKVAMSGEMMKRLEKETKPDSVQPPVKVASAQSSGSSELPNMRGVWRDE